MQSNITSIKQAEAYLASFVPKNVKMTGSYNLDTMKTIMSALGNPQENYKVIHVAGTSGKTSTAYFASALLIQTGVKVGLSVSPHVDSVEERVQIQGKILPEAEYCAALNEFIKIIDTLSVKPTYFELLVAFTFWEFDRAKVDYAVIEVGMGGLLDGTNVINRADKVCIITDIGLDHTEFLGDTLSQIAAQKAGIIHTGNQVFTYQQGQEVDETIEQTTNENQGVLHIVPQPHPEKNPELPLFQRRNLFLAESAVNFVIDRDGLTLRDGSSGSNPAGVYIPARMEEIQLDGRILILDGSHNGQKMNTLVRSVQLKYPEALFTIMMALTSGKDVDAVLAELQPIVEHLILTKFSGQQDLPKKAIDPQIIADAAGTAGINSVEIIENPEQAFDALQQSNSKFALVTGSFFLLNHVRPKLREQGAIT